jgi:hypothetical protein
MRTTLSLDDDVIAEIERLRRAEGIGLSEAVNRLVRRAAARPRHPTPYRHRSAPIGVSVDITSVADVLELLDDSPTDAR